ncbi:MAG: glucose-6-phosphate isomerase, partial [Synergistota bacterium]|nr:glucose-6-phosphate isomerase [Synergistota bacterium]
MTENLAKIDYGAAFPPPSHGCEAVVTPESLNRLEPDLLRAALRIEEGARNGENGFGWFTAPEKPPAAVLVAAEKMSRFDNVIHVGIGGSSLGNIMLSSALKHPFYNGISRRERGGSRLFVADNADPETTKAIWDMVDPAGTAIVVASKSGATAETMANFLWFWDRLKAAVGDRAPQQVLVVTDPEKGVLRQFASETGCSALEVPSDLGGRYSVLSPVGLVTAALQGIDVPALLDGASRMKNGLLEACSTETNMAWILAGISTLHAAAGRPMIVMMPYSDRLCDFTEWFAQLWAESLGKNGKGTTPVRALGAVDQHSQVQLYADGPDDKLYLFIAPSSREALTIPPSQHPSLAPLSYLYGKSMGNMLDCEAAATAATLSGAGKPVLWLEIPTIDATRLGALVFLFEYVTALAGFVQGVDPFDQPGVEQ